MRGLIQATDDEALVLGLARRDPAAVEALLERWWAWAWRVARALTGDPVAAEDVAQEALVEAIRSAPRFRPGARFRPWLLGILRNVARVRRRSSDRRAAHESRAALLDEQSPAAGPAEAAETAERLELLRGGLERIDPLLREALVLRYLEGLSLAEAAEALGCPEGTVSSRVRRGQDALREVLAPALAGIPSLEWLLALGSKLEAPPPPAGVELLAAAGSVVPVAPAARELLAAAARRGGPSVSLLGALLVVAAGAAIAGRVVIGPEVAGSSPVGRVASAGGTVAGGSAAGGSAAGGSAARDTDLAGSQAASHRAEAMAAAPDGRRTVRGRLVAPVLEGAWVALHPLDAADSLRRADEAAAAALGRPGGRWAVPPGATPVGPDGGFELPAGPGLLLAGARGCVTRGVRVDTVGPRELEVALAWLDPADVELVVLDPYGRPFERVSLDGALIAGTPLLLADLGPLGKVEGTGLGLAGLSTDEEGRIGRVLLPPGRWTTTRPNVVLRGQRDAWGLAPLDLTLLAGSRPVVELQARPYPKSCWLRVEVVDAAGAPVPGAFVATEPVEGAPLADPVHAHVLVEKEGDFAPLRTGPTGWVVFRGLFTGSRQVFAREGLRGGRSEVVHLLQENAGGSVRVVLDEELRTGEVRVALQDEATGEPVERDRVPARLGHEGGTWNAGARRFPHTFTDLLACEHWVSVRVNGYSESHVRFTPDPERTIEVVLPLRRTRVVSGRVVGEAIPEGTRVSLDSEGDGGNYPRAGDAMVGPDGRFSFTVAYPPPYRLLLEAPGWAPVAREGWDPAAGEAVLVLDGQAPTLRTRVVDPHGVPLRDLTVHFSPEDDPAESHRVDMDAEGWATWRGLGGIARVRTVVNLDRPDWAQSAETEVVAIGADRTDHVVRCFVRPARVALRGRVVDPAGRPLSHVEISCSWSTPGANSGAGSRFTTGADGCFELEAQPGEASLFAARTDRPMLHRNLTVPVEGLVGLDVVMGNGARVTGRVSRAARDGEELTLVARRLPWDGYHGRQVELLGGRFDLGSLVAGEWELRLYAGPFDEEREPVAARRITLVEGIDQTDLVLELP